MPVLLVEQGELSLAQVDEALGLLARALPGFEGAERELAWVSVDRLLEVRFALRRAEEGE